MHDEAQGLDLEALWPPALTRNGDAPRARSHRLQETATHDFTDALSDDTRPHRLQETATHDFTDALSDDARLHRLQERELTSNRTEAGER